MQLSAKLIVVVGVLCAAMLAMGGLPLVTAHVHASKASIGYEHVTCGSVVKLTHAPTGAKLHSHEVKYGTGSTQQSVTGFPQADDTNSYWTVRGPHDEYCERGHPIKCGDVVRLTHLNTRRNLHSHQFQSPLSGLVEVSAFGEGGNGDAGDNWKAECTGSHWMRNADVRLRHVTTGQYLHITGRHQFGRPIQGQHEVAAYARPSNENVWRAEEGIYIKYERPETDEDDE
ncbi:mannosyltransferase [Capsaspora owczarzaki ATCC 30864]|uniref:Mannosyltransferase n=1 Tax=Capsaspora owczarzaki (strain ATCC 30864) TaxID=595528 RepID=A0A0D2WV25_CAPO3|nr:mannosyltransferase [Capsaspora owczarzaki ATCC 30864]KJE95958.1 mannosyltransferase [Capsaspora owczarzaki ATCC 30864]|eukprot:XP_004345090.1 mannosyltransferase [Capsaspora owczarzaki ATCC 30864]